MHEMKAKMKDLECTKEKLMCWLKEEFEHGKEMVNTHEAGQVVDMIKDLAEAEEKCWKACYYMSIVKAMKEEEEEDDEERRGYDNYRYASGRFAPKGRGTRRGYVMPEYPAGYPMYPPVVYDRMGYTGGDSSSSTRSSSGGSSTGSSNRSGYVEGEEGNRSNYGMNYDRYAEARRHYTMSHTQKDKDDMEMHANQHVAEAMASMREIWKHAEPEMKTRMKTDLTNLINELK